MNKKFVYQVGNNKKVKKVEHICIHNCGGEAFREATTRKTDQGTKRNAVVS